ncbi:unnamed protein product [Mucor hiemalis]
MLSPVRFYEDTIRVPPFYDEKIGLRAIHEAYRYKMTIKLMEEWRRVMGDEPYDLTVESLHDKNSYASLTCIVCFSLIQSPWNEYAEWRTDHSIALLCHCCYATFTVKHVGKANLNADNAKEKKTLAGLSLEINGKPRKVCSPNMSFEGVKALPFNRGLKPLDDYLRYSQEFMYNALNDKKRKKVIDAIQSTYLCTPYRASSLDLIQAVARQYKFAVKVTKSINWNVPDGIIHGIRNYSKFLAIIKENPDLKAVPTIEIDLAWHTHMLHHKKYRLFCFEYIGKLINHDENIPETELEAFVVKTDQAWKKRNRNRRVAVEEVRNRLSASDMKVPDFDEKSSYFMSEKPIKKAGFTDRVKTIFSSSKKSNDKVEPLPTKSQTLPVKSQPPKKLTIKNEASSDGYLPEHKLFKDKFFEGNYKSVPDNILDVDKSEIKKDEEKITNTGDTTYNVSKQLSNASSLANGDPLYDKKKVSYHSEKDIKSFINLKNDDKLMNDVFHEVKRSNYGFIGTSTCANTDYLDQWNPFQDNLIDLDEKDGSGEKIEDNVYSPSYSQVFLTKGQLPKFTSDGVLKLPLVTKSKENHKAIQNYYSSFSKAQGSQYRSTTSSANFNWHLISSTWSKTNAISCDNDINTGGWSNCLVDSDQNRHCEPKSCAPASGTDCSTSHQDSSNYSSCGVISTSYSGVHSNCGGGTSSYGGGSSNCGGSTEI